MAEEAGEEMNLELGLTVKASSSYDVNSNENPAGSVITQLVPYLGESYDEWLRTTAHLTNAGKGGTIISEEQWKTLVEILKSDKGNIAERITDLLHSGRWPSSDLGGTASCSSADSKRKRHESIQRYRYDVFISFRGPDTRNTFVDHLYAHLIRKGIFAFKDDNNLQKGQFISPQLLQAIKDSRISIIVFSKDYASSTWCLDEMAAIAECHQEFKQDVFPVFFDVDPSYVRKQKGAYEKSFVLHAEKSIQGSCRVDIWKRAMSRLAGLSGWDVRNKPQFEVIKEVVQGVIQALGHKFSGFADDLIGIQQRVQELECLLELSPRNDNVRVVGIWGMGGIGKTTLATVLYDRVSYQFEACCFIENISKIHRDEGVIGVQKQILRRTINEKNLEYCSPSEISGIIRSRMHNMKLLIVLDNVDQFEQLHELHIDPKLLCDGSRLIITTRDEHILREYGADKIHEVQLMNACDAHELLDRKALKSNDPRSSFTEMIPEVLNYAQGLPLAIKVMGSFLCSRDASQWRATLNGLQHNPIKGIMKVLQVSFEGLEQREREIFLHIACFFKGEREDFVRRILDACGLHPDIGISLLIEKSLITTKNQEVHMHEVLQELGKKIVREQYPDEPEFWSRLWLYEDFHRVMMTETGATTVKAIVLDQKEDGFKFNKLRAEELSKMTHLSLLILCHKNFSGRPVSLSNCLRYLSWNDYPFASLPSRFHPYGLVELNMSGSSMEHLWEGIMNLPHLKRMDLSNSRNLKETPSFQMIQNLERLDFTGCINLSEVHPSIGLLAKLVFLSLQNCCSLVTLNFGSPVSRLLSLRVLRLSGCTKLENTPNFKGALNLEYLDMDQCTSLTMVHESIVSRAKLKFLSLRDCTNIIAMPLSHEMTSLMTLDLWGCSKFRTLPWECTFGHMVFLDLSFCSISEIPKAIGESKCLERLNLQGTNIVSLPSFRISRLAYLNLSHCHKLESFEFVPSPRPKRTPLAGRYFKTTSGTRDHRSGLNIFDCPMVVGNCIVHDQSGESLFWSKILFQYWILRLVKDPQHFRGGFDIVTPWHWKNYFPENLIIPPWFKHRFEGSSVIRTTLSGMNVHWVGFVFCVAFEVNNPPGIVGSTHCSCSSSPLPHPFYLSFESEHTEERFDMPLSLELNKVDGSTYLWIIYISQEHCHFVKTGAQITFKARQGLTMMEWGLRMLTKEDIKGSEGVQREHLPLLLIDNVREGSSSNNSSGPKIQLPYNWFVSNEEEVENHQAKGKETNLFNIGLEIGRP